MKALLIIMMLWPDGHRDIATRKHMASMDLCTSSLKEVVHVWMEDYQDELLESHLDHADNFVVVAYCALRISKSDPA